MATENTKGGGEPRSSDSGELADAQQRNVAHCGRCDRIRQAVIDCRRHSAGGWHERRRALHELEERLNVMLEIQPDEVRTPPKKPPSLLQRTSKLMRKAAIKAALWKRRDQTPPDVPGSPP